MGGNLTHQMHDANFSGARSVLLMALVTSLGGVWLLENPRSSWMFHHPRVRWLASLMRVASMHTCPVVMFCKSSCCSLFIFCVSAYKVWRCDFWMIHFESPTPKRTSLISNSKARGAFDRGPLRNWRKAKKYLKAECQTTRRYRGRDGKMKYDGTKALRQTERGA